jgi:serine O-acetyltransferase
MGYMPKNILVKANSIAIIGWEEGTAGQIHSWLEKQGQYHIACFVHISDDVPDIDVEAEKKKRDSQLFNYPTKTSFKDKPLITAPDWVKALKSVGIGKVLVTLNNKKERLQRIDEARQAGLKLINAIHPSAVIFDDARLRENVIIHARAVVGYLAEIYDGVIINTGAQIDHHNIVREGVTIDPGVVTGGNVTFGTCAQVHTGVVIRNRICIGRNSILGAGTVIIEDVPDNVTVVGVPGKIIKRHEG